MTSIRQSFRDIYGYGLLLNVALLKEELADERRKEVAGMVKPIRYYIPEGTSGISK